MNKVVQSNCFGYSLDIHDVVSLLRTSVTDTTTTNNASTNHSRQSGMNKGVQPLVRHPTLVVGLTLTGYDSCVSSQNADCILQEHHRDRRSVPHEHREKEYVVVTLSTDCHAIGHYVSESVICIIYIKTIAAELHLKR